MANLLIYPLYRINGRNEEFLKHKKFVEKNIEIVNKFNCVDDIIVLTKEVSNWSDMIGDIFHSIQKLVQSGNNVLFSEADTIFLKPFDEIYSIDKMMMFSNCGESSNIDLSLSEEYYLNGGFVYYPHNISDNIWSYIKRIDFSDTIKNIGNTYEVIVNQMYYSQFADKEMGINFLKKFGIFKYNWRCLSYSDTMNIRHIHFLNMSYYTSDKKFFSFWYENFFDEMYEHIMNNKSCNHVIVDMFNFCKNQDNN